MSRVTATILVHGRALTASTGQLLVLANPNSNTLKVPAGTKNLVFIGEEGANPDKYAVVN